MRKNQIILDEASRGVRRAFVGSLAGSVTMLGVIGAAGAYGMPERISAQSLSSALTSLQIKLTPVVDNAGPIVDRAMTMAASVAPKPRSIAIESDDEVILQVPRFALASASPAEIVERPRRRDLAAPITPPADNAADIIALPQASGAPPAGTPAAAAVAQPPAEPVTATAALPAPPVAVPSRPVRAMPDVASGPSALPAPLVFEQPQLDKIQPLTALPKIEVVEAAKAVAPPQPVAPKVAAVAPEPPKMLKTVAAPAEAPKAVEPSAEPAMSAMASANPNDVEMPNPEDYPKMVFVHLPLPRPPLSPAQRLDLHGAEYDKAEKCLAQAIYFEARAEPVRGQQAVAQVVLNRVFSPYYPKDVCSVVFQNAHRHLSCQFTFACDGKPEAIRERGSWARANRIARQALTAQVWLPEVAKATHYHATYVRPDWIRDMKLLVKHGVHIFYRPRNWGDGSKEAQWATPSAEAAAAPAPTKVAHKKGTKS